MYQGTAPTRSFMSLWHPIKCSCRMKSTLAVSPGSSWYGWCNKWTHVNTCWSDVWIQWSRWMYFSLPLLIGMGHTYMIGPTAILEWHQPPDSLYLFLPLPIMLFFLPFLAFLSVYKYPYPTPSPPFWICLAGPRRSPGDQELQFDAMAVDAQLQSPEPAFVDGHAHSKLAHGAVVASALHHGTYLSRGHLEAGMGICKWFIL